MKSLLCGLSVFTLTCVSQANTIINFDNLAAMSNSPGASVPDANRLSDQLLSSHQVVFSSGAGYVAVVNHAFPTVSMPNIIGGTAAGGTLSYGSEVEIKFMLDAGTKGMVDYFKVRGDQVSTTGSAYMSAFDAAGNLLGSGSALDTDLGLTLELSMANIHRVVLTQDSATIGFDNVEYSAVTAVPEPGTLGALALAGLCLIRKARR